MPTQINIHVYVPSTQSLYGPFPDMASARAFAAGKSAVILWDTPNA